MRYLFSSLVVLCLSIVSIGAPSTASAQVPPARALFLDLETVFTQSSAGANIRTQLEGMLAEISTREEAAIATFEERERTLMASAQNRPQEELQKDWEQLQTERSGNANLFQLERGAVQSAALEARRKVNAVLNEIMQEILVERGANMVLSVGAVHVGGVDYDITAEVIARLDKRLPALKVERPN